MEWLNDNIASPTLTTANGGSDHRKGSASSADSQIAEQLTRFTMGWQKNDKHMMATYPAKGKEKASDQELESPFPNPSKRVAFVPSDYGSFPRPLRLLAPTVAPLIGIADDLFMENIAEEDESFDGIVIINAKLDIEITAQVSVQKNDGRGPSFDKVLSVTEKLRRGQYENGGIKLERVKKIIINGIWDIKDAWTDKSGQGIGQTPDEQKKEEKLAVNLIAAVVKAMACLEEFEWTTELPFTKTLWPSMSAVITNVSLNLFRSGMEGRGRDDVFPTEDLAPLREFKSLKRLSLCGMLDSYQRRVWETVWVLPSLKHLDLRMALEPEHRVLEGQNWPIIRKGWKIQKFSNMKPSYWGRKGRGLLNLQWGYGEYLDIMSIRKAWCKVHPKQGYHPRMKLESLTLGNFVVDAGPFVDVFDESALERLQFVDTCLDAGIALPPNMFIGLRLIVSADTDRELVSLQTAKFYPAESAKLVDIPTRTEKGKEQKSVPQETIKGKQKVTREKLEAKPNEMDRTFDKASATLLAKQLENPRKADGLRETINGEEACGAKH